MENPFKLSQNFFQKIKWINQNSSLKDNEDCLYEMIID
jgi:hypothetical protein